MNPEKFTIDFDAVITEEELQATETSNGTETTTTTATADKSAAENISTETVTDNNTELNEEDLIEPTTNTDDDTLKPTLKTIGTYLKDESILPDLDLEKFTGDPEEFKQAIEEHINNKAASEVEAYKASVPEVIKQLLNNWEDDVPLDQLIDIKSNQIKYSSLTEEKLEENVNLQKDVYTKYLKETTKFSDKKISDMVAKAEEEFTLEELVKTEALPELKTIEANKEKELVQITNARKEQAKKDNIARLDNYKESINKTTEIIPGIKLSEEDKKQVFNAIVSPVAEDGNGNPVSFATAVYMKDPAKFDATLNYLLIKTKGFTDFSKLTTVATTNATKKLAQDLESSRNLTIKPKSAGNNSIKSLTPAELIARNFKL